MLINKMFKKFDGPFERDLKLPNKLIPFIWFFTRQMKWQFFAVFVLLSLASGCWAMIPYFTGEIVNILEAIAKTGDRTFTPDFINLLVVFITVCFVLQPVIVHVGIYIQAKTISHFTNLMRHQLSFYIYGHSYSFFQSDFSGRLAGKVVETPSAIKDVIHSLTNTFLWQFVILLVSFVLLFNMSFSLFAGGCVWILFYATIMAYFTPRIKKLSELGSIERSHVRGRAVDIISNISTIKLFSTQDHEDKGFVEKLRGTVTFFEKSDLMTLYLFLALEGLSICFWGFTVGYTINAWLGNDMTLGQVAMILPLTYQLTEITWQLSTQFSTFFQNLGEIEEGMETLVKPHELIDKTEAEDLVIKSPSIHVRDVSFKYPENPDKMVMDDFDLTIDSYQKIGLVGTSGAGKSTLINLLLRFFDVTEGQINIDGQNIAEVTQQSLRRNIAVIPQDTSLFHRTLMENIRYGRLDATDDEVIEAAKQAHAHDFIAKLPEAYETMVGERGVKLSGGQRQRIAIARAILKDAPILVLDEATSALDSESEHAIQESLKELMKGKTVIAIAHRLSTIAHLDRIIVMEEGKIVEDGTHEELLATDRHYAMLWSMQSGGFLQE